MNSKKIALKSIAIGFPLAIGVIAIGFFSYTAVRPVTQFVWAPGEALVALSNHVCPPSGVACVFGNVIQGTHHKWLFICLFGSWWFIMSLIAALALTRRSKRRAASGASLT